MTSPTVELNYVFHRCSCKILTVWFSIFIVNITGKSADFFIKECNTKEPHYLVPCKKVRYIPIVVDVKKAVETVKFAFERLGYSMGRSW